MKKKHPEHVNLERWLVSYADFITLLFAFFVIMFSLSQSDLSKFKKVSASIRAAFSGVGASAMLDIGGTSGGNTANMFQDVEPPGGRILNLPAGKTHTAADTDPELQEIRERLEESINLELGVADVSDKLQMQFDSRGLVVRITAKGFFEQSETVVRPDLRPILDRIGRILTKTRRMVRVEGHSDVSETHVDGFLSDWEFSAARAAWVVQYWVQKYGLDPKRLGAVGYSHFRPVSEDPGEWGRARNRRVEVIVLNNLYDTP